MAAATTTSAGHSSDDDGEGNPFAGHETIATLPIPMPFPQTAQADLRSQYSSPPPFVTQPTQMMDTPVMQRSGAALIEVAASSPVPESHIQVSASSPATQSTPGPTFKPPFSRSDSQSIPAPTFKPPFSRPGLLASAMAPPGTFFQRPAGVQPAPPVIDISDDESVIHRGTDSEDDLAHARSNIKPSTFANGGRSQVTRVADSPISSSDKFKSITSAFAYNDVSNGKQAVPQKRPADDMASAYGAARRPAKQVRQTGPSRARPVTVDLDIDDITDYEVRQKIKRMASIYPNKTIVMLRDALAAKKGNFDDAIAYIVELEENEEADLIDLTGTNALKSHPPKEIFKQPVAKRKVQAPNKTIQEKWSSTQAVGKSSVARESSPLVSTPEKPRGRLVRGRRNPTPPVVPSSPVAPSPPVVPSPRRPKARQRAVSFSSESASDSGVSSGDDEEQDDEAAREGLLGFLNVCSVEELADLSNNTEEVARAIIAARPFDDLDEVRTISMESAAADGKAKTKKRSQKKPIGDKVVDVCLDVWSGYEAVDELVDRCEELGKPIAAEMQSWGIDVFGAARNGGELEILNLDDTRDSGIGTPSSSPAAIDVDADGEVKTHRKSRRSTAFLKQPAIMAEDFVLKDYQVVGLNWLSLLWSKNLSCILADDMGLGKTCQVISFLAHLYETGVRGPHLIIVPGSTLENWLREFQRFCPTLAVEPYYGSQDERAQQRISLGKNRKSFNVLVTTYDTAWRPYDNSFLRKVIDPVVCVFDEGHVLKNSLSKRYQELMRIPASFRLLLTGTPLQNNLQELSSLLAFMLPDLFKERQEDLAYIFKHKAKTTDSDHSALLSAQKIKRARSMITPFVLRRKKHQVLRHMPEKVRRVEYCGLHLAQKAIYADQMAKGHQALMDRADGVTKTSSTNIMMALRKAAMHPLLFRTIYTDAKLRKMSRVCLKEKKLENSDADAVFEDMEVMSDFQLHKLCEEYPTTLSRFRLDGDWMNSGKVEKLCELLKKFKANGDRTLIFSQFTTVMDILEAVLETLEIQFFRLDGNTPIPTRQDMLDEFYKDESIPVFMLSTKAGGSGINLACANKVIIFDSSFNPQDDIQAENRAHRVGQTREVEVIRLVTKDTIEEQIHTLGISKLALDERVAGEGVSEEDGEKAEREGMGIVEKIMMEELQARESCEKVDKADGKDCEKPGDVKDEYLEGLKAAGLDIVA